jgi:uncharacterized protein YdgA (DUF945 family)
MDAPVKKTLIVVCVVLLVILLSPAVVGKLAEKSVNEQLSWAATGASSGELDVKLESFESSWFTSRGVHYVGLGDGSLRQSLLEAGQLPDPDNLPRLRIETRIDHGLIPISSMQREGGSLTPALGSAMSTMAIEMDGVDPIVIPGAVFSKIGLTGGVDSEYVLPAGSHAAEGEVFSWKDGGLRVKANPATGRIVSDAAFAGFSVTRDNETISVGEVTYDLDTRPGNSGVYIGGFSMQMESVSIAGATPMSLGPFNLASNSEEDGDRINSDVSMDFAVPNAPMVGDLRFDMKLSLLGADAVALKNLSDRANTLDDSLPPEAVYELLEPDLVRLVAGGFTMNVSQLDLALAQGLIDAGLEVIVPESDAAQFSWGAAIQSASGKASLSMPAALVQLVSMASPEANMLVTMGLLQESGDLYTMEALYEKGLLTINGMPIPLPIPTS